MPKKPKPEKKIRTFVVDGRPIQVSFFPPKGREKSPMGAKMKAKKNKDKMVVVPMSEADLDHMRLVLNLKVEQHPELRHLLIQTGDALIVEDCTRRQRGSGLFWGAALIDGEWVGNNWLGRLWMELRAELSAPTGSLISQLPQVQYSAAVPTLVG